MSRFCRFLFFATVLLSAAAPVLPDTRVGGRVVGPDGEGLEGIRVGLQAVEPFFDRVDTWLDGKNGPDAEAEATTDADGCFELFAPRLGAWKVVAPWIPRAKASGDLPAESEGGPRLLAREYLLDPLTEEVELPPVRLEHASVREIRVVNPDGAPVEARLALSDTRRQRDWRVRSRLARTADDGTARLFFHGDEKPHLAACHPSYRLRVLKGEEVTDLVRLEPGVSGNLRIVDPSGRRVAGAVVFQKGTILALGRTDDEGLLKLTVAPRDEDPPTLGIVARDGLFSKLSPRVFAEATDVTLQLNEQIRLRGQVVDRKSRRPVPGALVWGNGSVTETDARGSYELLLYPAPRYTVQAAAKGFGKVLQRPELTDSTHQDGPTLELSPVARIAGQVVGEDGRSIAGVDVTAEPKPEDLRELLSSNLRERESRTSRQGRFTVSRLVPSMAYELVFRKDGFAPSRRRVEGLAAFEERGDVEVVLGRGVTGIGWVTEESGTPIAGATVRLVPAELPASGGLSIADDAPPPSTTDAEGRFRFAHVVPGRYDLEADAPGFVAAAVPGLRLAPGAGTEDFGTLVLVPGIAVAVVVRDPEGAAVEGARVYLTDGPRIFLELEEPLGTSDARGRFYIPDRRSGAEVHLAVAKKGFSTVMASTVAAHDEVLEVVLEPAGSISGRVLNRDGEPVGGASVIANLPEAGDRELIWEIERGRAESDEHGYFRIDEVNPGSVRLEVEAPGYQEFKIRDLQVPARGELSGVDIVLERGATIVGTVSWTDGRPAAQVVVTCSPPGQGRRDPTGLVLDKTDRQGRFELTGVPPGPAVLRARPGLHQEVSEFVEVTSGMQTVDLVLGRGYEISGRVTDGSGQGVGDATLTLLPADSLFGSSSRPAEATTGPGGGFTLADIVPGLYRLAASKQGYAQAVTPEPFEVGRERNPEIELELRPGTTLRGDILGLELDDLADVEVTAAGGAAAHLKEGLVDHTGRYSVADLSPGSWQVVARLEAGREARGNITIHEGQLEVELDLEFQPGYALTGRVTSVGEPQAGLLVVAQGAEPGLLSAYTETRSDGSFRLGDLPPGTYVVMASDGGAMAIQEVAVPAPSEIVLEIAAAGVSGVVHAADGRPLEGAAVLLEPVEPDPSRLVAQLGNSQGVTDSRGRFSLGGQEGSWRLVASKPGIGRAEILVELRPGDRIEGLELRMTPPAEVTFEVVHRTGMVPAQVRVAVLDASVKLLSQESVPVGPDGTVRLSTVPPGKWRLLVQADDSAVVSTTITAPGSAGRVELTRGGILQVKTPTLEGRDDVGFLYLKDADGNTQYFVDSSGLFLAAWLLRGGETTVPRVLPGSWKVTAILPPDRIWQVDVSVTAGATSELVVP